MNASENFYQIVLENTFDCINIVNEKGVFTYLNTNAAKIFGYEVDELINTSAIDLLLEGDKDFFERNIRDLLDNPSKEIALRARFKHKKGHLVYVQTYAINLINNQTIKGILTNFIDITTQIKLEKQLYEVQNYQQILMDSTQHSFLLLDLDGKILFINKLAQKFVEKASQKIIGVGNQMKDFLEKENLKRFEKNINKCIGERQRIISQSPVRVSPEKVLWFEVLYVPIFDKNDAITAIAFSASDITTKHYAEKNLIQNKVNLQAILDNTIQAFFLIDTDYKLVSFNQQAHTLILIYHNREPQIGEDAIALLLPQYAELFKQHFQKCLDGDTIKLERVFNIPQSEQKFWYEIILSPVRNNNAILSVILSFHDITARKLTEEKLRKSEIIYRTISENYPNGTVNILDRNFRAIFAEGQAYKTHNLNLDDFLNKSIYEVFPPESIHLFEENYQKSFEGETRIFEYTSPRSHYLISSIPLFNENQEVENILVVSQDIAELKKNQDSIKELNTALITKNKELEQQKGHLLFANEKLKLQQENLAHILNQVQNLNTKLTEQNNELAMQEEELKVANEQLINKQEDLQIALEELSDRNFELDQIVYRTSHDIRSPLTSVMGLLNVMRLEGIPDNLVDYTLRIEQSIQKLDRFVSSMLNFAKANRVAPKSEIIDFEELIEKTFDNLRYIKNFDKIEKTIKIIGKENIFRSDLLKLDIVFANIVSNAIKYANINQSQSYLNITVEIEPKYTNITIQDNGIGIRQAYLDKVFDMFFRATDKSEGSGLGLYIVKQTIEKLSGRIEIQSEYGAGTIIEIYLPSIEN